MSSVSAAVKSFIGFGGIISLLLLSSHFIHVTALQDVGGRALRARAGAPHLRRSLHESQPHHKFHFNPSTQRQSHYEKPTHGKHHLNRRLSKQHEEFSDNQEVAQQHDDEHWMLPANFDDIAKQGSLFLLEKDAKGRPKLVKPKSLGKKIFKSMKKFFTKKDEPKKDKTEDKCDGEICELDMYNYQPFGDSVSVSASVVDDLFAVEASMDTDLDISTSIQTCGAVCSLDKNKIAVGGGLPSAVPIVKFKYEKIYSTADQKWIGKVVNGGLDFVFFSTNHIKVYQGDEEVKNFSKISLFGLSYIRTKERVGDKMVPVTRDVHFSISSPTPMVKVSLNKSVTKGVSKLFSNFGKDWYGEYKMDGKSADIDDIVAGGERAVHVSDSIAKKMKKKLKKMLKLGSNAHDEESNVELLSYRALDSHTGSFADKTTRDSFCVRKRHSLIDCAEKASAPLSPIDDPFDGLSGEELSKLTKAVTKIA